MTTEQAWAGVAAAVALVALPLALLAMRRAHRAEARVAVLVDRVALLAWSDVAPATDPAAGDGHDDTHDHEGHEAYLITRMDAGEQAAVPLARPIDGRLFVDIVARESVVKAASWTHGLRRALSPENRNRIRFAVRQETRRATRERRSEMKQALRELRARERAGLTDRLGEDVA